MDTPAELAAKKLAWNVETLASVDLTVTTTINRPGGDSGKSPAFNLYVEHYIGTAAGQRLLEFRGMKAGAIVSRSDHYGDRGRFTDVNYGVNDSEHQQSIYVTNHFFMEDKGERKQIPQPLLFFYVGHKPLNQALPGAEHLGTAECLGRECDVFLFRQVRWAMPLDQVFSMDKRTGVPLKVEMYRDAASREAKRPATSWAAKSLDAVQGHDIPLKSTSMELNKDGAPAVIWEHSVDRIEFDREFPASTFQPVLQPGVTVLDGISNKSYTTPGAKPAPPVSSSTTAVEATPPRDWAGLVSTGSLVLGASLVAAGAISWWRRR